MPGLRVPSTDGAGWTAETVELALTIRRRRGHAEPIGDGAQLCVRRHGRLVAYCASPDETWPRWAWTCPGWPWPPGRYSSRRAGRWVGPRGEAHSCRPAGMTADRPV
jgi:hypothetical protein